MPNSSLKTHFAVFCACLLAACGTGNRTVTNDGNPGGGSTSSSSSSSSTGSSSSGDVINVGQDDPGERVAGETFNVQTLLSEPLYYGKAMANEPEQTGDVNAPLYVSSDENIATVDSQGNVQVLTAGAVTIAAKVQGNTVADLDIASMDPNFTLQAWVGQADSEYRFGAGTQGMHFYRSRDEDCELEGFTGCSYGQYDTVGTHTIADTATQLSQAGFLHFKFGRNLTSSSVLGSASFPERQGANYIVYKDKLWAIGGVQNTERRNDVWSSTDGNTWVQVTANAPWTARDDATAVVFKNKLWLISGATSVFDVSSEVWSTTDGKNWTLETASAPFEGRIAAVAYVVGDTLYFGSGASGYLASLNDLWKSTDGVNWTEVGTGDGIPGSFWGNDVAELNGQYCLIADAPGSNELGLYRREQAWTSNDGENWVKLSDDLGFGYFPSNNIIVFDNKFWFFGYSAQRSHGYIWTSEDCQNWEKVAGGVYFGNLYATAAKPLLFKERIFLVGGKRSLFQGRNDVYSSTDGLNWQGHGDGGLYGARAGHSVTYHNDEFWSVGGWNFLGDTADVWSSPDGVLWTQRTSNPAFGTRQGHKILSYKGKLYLIGGKGNRAGITFTNSDGDVTAQTIIQRAFGDVWVSEDGIEWARTTDEAPFSAREIASAIVFDNKLWLVSGGPATDEVIASDVWSSEDGVNWTLVAANAAFEGRSGHALAVFDGKLFLSGGARGNGELLNDVWQTSDGVTWTQATAAAEFVERSNHPMFAHAGKLWIAGGQVYNYNTLINFKPTVREDNDIWSSEDGITWTEHSADPLFRVRMDHQVIVHEDEVFLFGGKGKDGYFDGSVDDQLLNTDYYYFQEVWKSSDLTNWRQGFGQRLRLIER